VPSEASRTRDDDLHFLNNVLSIHKNNGWYGDDIAENYEIPAAEARNRRGKYDCMDAACLEELGNFLRSGQVNRIEARRQTWLRRLPAPQPVPRERRSLPLFRT
jgi:hypothetical protein